MVYLGVYGPNSWFGRAYRKEKFKQARILALEESVLAEFRHKVPDALRERLLNEAQEKQGGLKFLSKDDTERIERQAAKAWKARGHTALMQIVWASAVITK